ncbi:Acb2/Tad1 domain-containing protein [Burkholderia sp. BDU5]|uniref:Acb2/Tad1 domain-containing protein n=1 Tax=Burkholderia sp. BDU5 TaxID=1385590 RepID=UPI0007544744|nr:hypothetical protein [Burkholderia sp. BDU5]KVE36205.1 hypothetical protein WS69_13355 [Burkholderia sp. BDU5]
MDNQHRMIAGYSELDQEDIDVINAIKLQGENLGTLFDMLDQSPDVDKRWLAIAKTDIQKGYMALVRAIARPTTFI